LLGFSGQTSAVPESPALPSPLLIACLCASWCRTCDSYRSTFDIAQEGWKAEYPQTRGVWVDVEDEADLLGDLDITDFPSLLIARGGEALFFGPVLPHASTLERMVRTAHAGELALAAPLPAEALRLLARLSALSSS
jgi:hypothetical protein